MTTKVSLPYDDFLEFLIDKVTPEDILSYQAPDELQARAIELLERSSEGELTSEEQAELDEMARVDRLVGVIKARALAALKKS
jgi:uncharacterized protein YciU (UPF0263 family)